MPERAENQKRKGMKEKMQGKENAVGLREERKTGMVNRKAGTQKVALKRALSLFLCVVLFLSFV